MAIPERTVVDELRELVERPSENPPGDEKEIAEYFVERFESSPVDFDVVTQEYEPDRPNVLARAGNPENGTLLLTGHMDVVPADEETWTSDPYTLRREDGQLYGRGTADMKGSIAAQIVAAEAYLTEVDDPGQVVLGYVVDEESTGHGTKHMVEEGLDVDAAILGEPTDLGLGLAHFGSVRYTIHVDGLRSHAARPREGINAIEGIRQMLNRIHDLGDEVASSTHKYLDDQSIKPTMLDAGVGGNVIPDEASMVVDWRFHPGPSNEEAFANRLENAFEDVDIDGHGVDWDLDLWQFTRGAEITEDEPVACALRDAAADLDFPIEPFGGNYGADTPHLIYDGEIPTVLFGVGNIDNAHAIDESISVEDLVTAANVYEATLKRFLG